MSPTQLADITLAGELMQFRSGKELSENKKVRIIPTIRLF